MPQQKTVPALDKVATFITRGKPGTRHLLVFDHAGGIQIPAGTVLENETTLHAALREALEETGLPDLTLVAELGSRRAALPADERVMLGDALLQLSPDTSSTVVRGTVLRRGTPVKMLEQVDDFMRVLHEEARTDASGETVVTARRSGWVPSVLLSGTIERYFYHLQSEIPTSERWQVQAEPEHVFTCYWLPLKANIRLMGSQQEWLDSFHKSISG
jgi:hypothetical protein